MNKNDKIFVAGHKGMVGSAIVRELNRQGYNNLVLKNHEELNLIDQGAINKFFNSEKIDYVFLAAGRVGGILANSEYIADFLYENMMIEMNVINAAFNSKCKRLEFLGSSCIYPKHAKQPIKEEYLLSSKLEETNEGYSLAKIAGLKYCEYLNRQYGTNYLSLMPTNMYGINDHYDIENSHVLPALIHKFHLAKVKNESEVVCFGDGSALRDFLYVDDFAKLCVMLMNNEDESGVYNASSGREVSIRELAEIIKDVVGYSGNIVWDTSKPNGTPRKALDNSKVNSLGWQSKTTLEDGIKIAYQDYLSRKI